MKTRKYKFDTVWSQAISLLDHTGGDSSIAEQQIRRYIEHDDDPTEEIRNTPFECAWLLIKAQIDTRKLRNERARQRRRRLKELKSATSPHTGSLRKQSSPVNPSLPANASTPAKTASSSKSHVRPTISPEEINRIIDQAMAEKPRFSDRFRGPGLAASGKKRIKNKCPQHTHGIADT